MRRLEFHGSERLERARPDCHRYKCDDADVSLPPLYCRAGFCDAGCDVSWPCGAWVGKRRIAQRCAGAGLQMAGVQGAHGEAPRTIALMRRLWNEERVTFDGQSYKTEKATLYDRPERPSRSIWRLRSHSCENGWRDCRRLYLHQRQGPGALHGDVAAECGGRTAGRRPGAGGHRPHDRDEGVV